MQIPSAEWAGSEPADRLGGGLDGGGGGDGCCAAACCWAARCCASWWFRATRRAERAWARPKSRRTCAVTWPPVNSASSLAAEPGRPYWESWTAALEALVETLPERPVP